MEVLLIRFVFRELKTVECLQGVFIELLLNLQSVYARCLNALHVKTFYHTMLYCCPTIQVWQIGIVKIVLNCILDIDKAPSENLRSQSLEKGLFLMCWVRHSA